MKTEKITPAVCKLLRTQMNDALAPLGKALGLKIDVGSARYSAENVTFKVDAMLAGYDPERKEFEAYADMYGLKPGDYGREVTIMGRRFKLLSIKPSRPKYPLLALDLKQNARVKLTTAHIDMIIRQLAAPGAAARKNTRECNP